MRERVLRAPEIAVVKEDEERKRKSKKDEDAEHSIPCNCPAYMLTR